MKGCSKSVQRIIIFIRFFTQLVTLIDDEILIDDLWCRTLGSSNFIQEDWHGRSKGEERSLRLIKLISHLWHGWEFLNPISLVLGQGKASVTGSLASVNRSYSLHWFILRTFFLFLTWKHAEKWECIWISYHTLDICSSAYFCFR
jgi:hypothetical protein